MSDHKPTGPTVIMKGGTSSSRYDKEIRLRQADAERRRALEAKRFEAARTARNAPAPTTARIGSHSLINQSSPRLVLYYMNKDGTVRQECKSEITMIAGQNAGEMDTLFALVCPACLARGVPQGEVQIMVRNSHRRFEIDERKKGVVMLRDPFTGAPDPVIVCGTVTVQDTVRCSNYNCNWAVKIGDSKVWEA
jgi:hypothetical protein